MEKEKQKEKQSVEDRKVLLPKLYRVWKTLIEMMEDRKFKITEGRNERTYNEWLDFFENKTINEIFYQTKEEEIIRIYFEYLENTKVSASDIENFVLNMKNAEASSGIIVISGQLTSQAKQKIVDINKVLQLEDFHISELMVNITKHSYVPQHILLTDEEKNILLRRYKIKENQLPKILTTDPVARYLGLRKGNVVKIIRNSETAGKYVTYRITV